ncbi:MAG: hypothetical protein KC776_02730 [Myxococcales bacterium]|nr:hypothetical protein [Myxococcales bacterium]
MALRRQTLTRHCAALAVLIAGTGPALALLNAGTGRYSLDARLFGAKR